LAAVGELGNEHTGDRPVPIPASFTIGDTRFEIVGGAQQGLRQPLERLGAHNVGDKEICDRKNGLSPATLSKWFSALGTLNRWTASLQELYAQSARVVVEAIGLDGAIILRRRDDAWEIAASHLPHAELGIHCDTTILDQLLATSETLFQGAESNQKSAGLIQTPESVDSPALGLRMPILDTLEPAVVVSPLRNASRALCGAIYGYRSVRKGNSRRGIRYLEANLVELLANAVSEGIARVEHEAQSERRRVMLEQLLAGNDATNMRQLAAQEREVTLLFADLRDFTRLSKSLDANLTCELLAQVMDCLTAAVLDHDGFVIDYYGDGLSAMWNAPADQAEHAELACRAALKMLAVLPNVAADWAEVLSAELRLGIGIHTGSVHVGNAGSRRRAKYGPRGPNVHLTSRLEKSTKTVGVPLLVSGATAARLSNRLHASRVGHAKLPGFDEPVDVFTVSAAPRA
jgi:adenylate cyclase